MADTEVKEADELSVAMRAEVARIIKEEGKSQAGIAREAALSAATFSAWYNGTYQGRNDQVAEKVRTWTESRKVAAQTRSAVNRGPGFVLTETASRIVKVLQHAQFAPDFVVIDGGPGVGKTETCKEYRRRSPHVFIVTAEPAWKSVRMVITRIAEELGIYGRYSTLTSSIVKRLQGVGALLIVDEANHLSTDCIDQLRTFHDLADCGVALVGNATVYSRLEGEGRTTHFAQLFSRIGMRYSQGSPLKADVDTLIAAWGVEGERETELLRTISRQPGALRGMTKTLRMALMGAKDALTEDDIKQAWALLSAGRAKGA